MELSVQLRELRAEMGMSQEEIAETLNVSRQAVAKWETGANTPVLDNLVALSALYDVSLDRLVKGNVECGGKARPSETPAKAPLIDFLLRASLRTYASGEPAKPDSSRPGSHDFTYSEQPFTYWDSYFGGERFAGEETVLLHGQPVWSMNYAGRVLSDGFDGDFLKEALRLRPRENPFRGPLFFAKGKHVYWNQPQGGFDWFEGREQILYEGTVVYEGKYHGGILCP